MREFDPPSIVAGKFKVTIAKVGRLIRSGGSADQTASVELRDLLAKADRARKVGAHLCLEAREMTAIAAKMRAIALMMRQELSTAPLPVLKIQHHNRMPSSTPKFQGSEPTNVPPD